jgi:transposase-like protein
MSKRRKSSEEFKRAAVGLARQSGESIGQVARDLGVGTGLLGWNRPIRAPLSSPSSMPIAKCVTRGRGSGDARASRASPRGSPGSGFSQA